MTWVVSAIGVLVSTGFMIAAGFMNWRYGHDLGRSPNDQLLFALIAAGVDTMKILIPFFFWWAMRNGRWLNAALCAFAIIALMSYSVIGIAGFVDMNFSQMSGSVRAKKATVTDLRFAQSRTMKQLQALGVVAAPNIVEKKLQSERQDRRWESSEECRNATVRESREFCAYYNKLQAEKAKGLEAQRLEQELTRLRSAITGLSGYVETAEGEARIDIVSRITGWGLLQVQTGLSLLFVGIVEGMATFGVFLSLNHGELQRSLARQRDRRGADSTRSSNADESVGAVAVVEPHQRSNQPRRLITHDDPVVEQMSTVPEFAAANLAPMNGAITCIGDLYPLYCVWCGRSSFQPISAERFEAEFLLMCKKFGFKTIRQGRAMCCVDIGPITSPAPQ